MQRAQGFTLVEVTLAIGIIAFALLAVLALVPVGLNSGRAAIDATRTTLILSDAQNRARIAGTSATFTNATNVTLPNLYYDQDGLALPGYAGALYRAIVTIEATWGANAPPPNVDSGFLRPVTIQLGWPVNASDGSVLAVNADRASFTFYIRKP